MMRRHISFFIGLGVVWLGVIVTAFVVVATPFSIKGGEYDDARATDFRHIGYAIESYYRANGALPAYLHQLSTKKEWLDPQTREPYTYIVENERMFRLCTTFSIDTRDDDSTTKPLDEHRVVVGSVDESASLEHDRGYQCIPYLLPEDVKYVTKMTPTPMQRTDNEPYSELRSALRQDRATFYFRHSGSDERMFYVEVSSGVRDFDTNYYTLATGTGSPLVNVNPTVWSGYGCGKRVYWRVTSDRGESSPTQAGFVECIQGRKMTSTPVPPAPTSPLGSVAPLPAETE